ncbi:unnamed protein product, partial [Rotaria sp. Silwood2]
TACSFPNEVNGHEILRPHI